MRSELPGWLAIDIGNTRIKFGWHTPHSTCPELSTELPTVDQRGSTTTRAPEFDQLAEWLPGIPARAAMISVSRPVGDQVATWWQTQFPQVRLDRFHGTDLGLPLDVEFPERVGADRVAAALAATWHKSPTHAAVVVDAGSAITVDGVSSDGRFLGGAIWPGQRLLSASLATHTDQLPQVNLSDHRQIPPALGRSTHAAIQGALYWGTRGAVGSILEQVKQELTHARQSSTTPEVDVLFTGGDGEWLAGGFSQARYFPDLVLQGIFVRISQTPAASNSHVDE